VRQGLDAAVRPPQRDPARGREQHAVERLDAGPAHLVYGDRAVDVLAQELLRAHEVELEILLDDAGACRIGERLEGDGGGIDQRRDIREAHGVAPARELELPLVPHHGIAGQRLPAVAMAVELGCDGARPRVAVDGERVAGPGDCWQRRQRRRYRERRERFHVGTHCVSP
jgi:hypothetical protein